MCAISPCPLKHKTLVPTLKHLLSADINYVVRSRSKFQSEGFWKQCSSRILFIVDTVFVVLTAQSPACKSITNLHIPNPYDRSSTSIPAFMLSFSHLRDFGCNNPTWLLFKVLSSELHTHTWLCMHTGYVLTVNTAKYHCGIVHFDSDTARYTIIAVSFLIV